MIGGNWGVVEGDSLAGSSVKAGIATVSRSTRGVKKTNENGLVMGDS